MAKKNYIIPIFVPHEGCPFDCIFCNQSMITGKKRLKDREEVKQDFVRKTINSYIKTIQQENANIEVAFFGGSFTGIDREIQDSLLSVAFEYKQKDIINGIRISTRPDYINESILKNLKKFGVTVIEIGVQSTDEDVLKLCRRGHGINEVISAAKQIKSNGFTLGMQMMIGLPADTLQKDINTANDIKNLMPDIVRIYPALVIKDTYLEQLYIEGKYKPLRLEEAVQQSKILLMLFERHNINVIRIGLQPTQNIAEGVDVIAGPFHPAFRELVESSIRQDMLTYLINKFDSIPQNIEVHINPNSVSETVGLKRNNIRFLQLKYGINKIKLIQDSSIIRDEIIIYNGLQSQRISKKEWLNKQCY